MNLRLCLALTIRLNVLSYIGCNIRDIIDVQNGLRTNISLVYRCLIMRWCVNTANIANTANTCIPYTTYFDRFLTYSYLSSFNVRLLLSPVILSYDWQMGSIQLITTVSDLRNVFALLLVMALTAITYKLYRQLTSSRAGTQVCAQQSYCMLLSAHLNKWLRFPFISFPNKEID